MALWELIVLAVVVGIVAFLGVCGILLMIKRLKPTSAEKLAKLQAKQDERKRKIAERQAKLDKEIALLSKAKVELSNNLPK